MKSQRIPRPKYLSLIKEKEDRVTFVLKDYITNGMKLLGKQVSIPELSTITNISVERIISELGNVSGMSTMFLEGREGLTKSARALAEVAIFWGLEDKHSAQKQAAILLGSQGDTYAPFISSEVNRAIKNNMEATSNIMKLYTTFFPQSLLADATREEEVTKKGVLYVEDMVTLIQDQRQSSPLQNTEVLDALRAAYITQTHIPNVIAIQQDDFKPEDLGASKNLPTIAETLIEHSNRREEELGINSENAL